ncbi:MAG: hypothetical protein MJ252_20795, partial [archaeon]|nr:hypothetical protein [archaeon]
MLYTSNLILLVGKQETEEFSPRKVTIWSTSHHCSLCSSYGFTSEIKVAKINKLRMIVIERDFLHVYSTADMKILHTIDVGEVPLGRLVLSPVADKNNFVCYSSSLDEGVVSVFDTLNLSFKAHIKAHKSPILKITINATGDKLATCSCKGTIIRIFSLPKGEKILTYKRGISYAFIFSLNFSADSDKLISTSDSGSVHIFDLKNESKDYNTQAKGLSKFFYRTFVTIAGKVMPEDYEDTFGTKGASLQYTLDSMKISNLAAFNPRNPNEAFAFTSDGTYYLFTINYDTKDINKIYD